MTTNTVVYAGTIGQAIWRSTDGGETFRQACAGMFIETDVRALAVHPRNPKCLYAGTDMGLFRTEDGGDRWERLQTLFDSSDGWRPAELTIWSLHIPPHAPDTLLVGTCPSAVYRSQDAGASWQKLNLDLAAECVAIRYPRVTCIASDPMVAGTLWVGVEIDGLHRSQDAGETWERIGDGLSSADIHALAFLPGAPGRMLASTNNDLNLSTDGGVTWQPQNVRAQFPHGYCRGILTRADDPSVVFVGNGSGPPGNTGTLQVSHDAGATWEAAPLPVPPNSTIWTFATLPDAPELIFAASVLGYLYRSEDGGNIWQKCHHEFGEIRALAAVIVP